MGDSSLDHVELSDINHYLDWLKTKIRLNATANHAKTRTVKRGQVYRCNLGWGIGNEMRKERPAIIVQNNYGNRNSGNTIVIPITHNSNNLPCMIQIEPKINEDNNIILDGQADVSNIICVSKARLGDYICTLPLAEIKSIDKAIAKNIDILKYYTKATEKIQKLEETIDTLKAERNQAQKELETIRTTFNIPNQESTMDYLKKMKNTLDNQ